MAIFRTKTQIIRLCVFIACFIFMSIPVMATEPEGVLQSNETAQLVEGTENTYYYTGKEVCPTVELELYLNGQWVTLDKKFYDLTYSNNINPTTDNSRAKVSVTFKGNYKGGTNFYFNIASRYKDGIDLSKATIEPCTIYYNAAEKTDEGYDYMQDIDPVVSYGGEPLIRDVDYTLSVYYEGQYRTELYAKGFDELKKAPYETTKYRLKAAPVPNGRCNPGAYAYNNNGVSWDTKAYDGDIVVEGFGGSESDTVPAFMLSKKDKSGYIYPSDIPGEIVIKDVSGNTLEDAAWSINGNPIVRVSTDKDGVKATFVIRSNSNPNTSNYNYYYSFSKEITVTYPHDWDEGEVHAPTCIAQGYTKYTCKDCGFTTTDDYVEATGVHTPETIAAVTPTCTTHGYTAGTRCSVCKYVISAPEDIGLADHNFEDKVVAPTCDRKGYTTRKCKDCGFTCKTDETEPLGHLWSDWDVQYEASCQSKGKRTRHCTRAGCSTWDTEYTDMKAHTPVPYPEVEATEEHVGYTGGTYCAVCNQMLTERTRIPIKPHQHVYKTYTEDPTCTEQGYTVHYCQCGNNYIDSYTDPLGHDFVVDTYKPATCTESGYTEKHCSRCWTGDVEYEEALGHLYENGKCVRCGADDPDYRKDHDSSSGSDQPREHDIDIITSSSSSKHDPENSSSSSYNGDIEEKDALVDASEYAAARNDKNALVDLIDKVYSAGKLAVNTHPVQYAGKKTELRDLTIGGAGKGHTIPGTGMIFKSVKYSQNKKVGQAKAVITLKAAKGATKAEKAAVKALNSKFKSSPVTYSIIPRDLGKCTITGTTTYKKAKGTWKFKLKANIGTDGKPISLKYNKKEAKSDFIVDSTYDGTTDTVTITGRGNFTGEISIAVTVK